MIIKTTSTDYGYFDPSISAIGAQYRDQYNSAIPFPHIVLPDFLDEDILELCLRDFPSIPDSAAGYKRSQENLKFEFKPETLSPPAEVALLFVQLDSIRWFHRKPDGYQGSDPGSVFRRRRLPPGERGRSSRHSY